MPWECRSRVCAATAANPGLARGGDKPGEPVEGHSTQGTYTALAARSEYVVSHVYTHLPR
eukprot:scaffold1621_cov350-Prasinococcus_capsulatus_cf.AAC.18